MPVISPTPQLLPPNQLQHFYRGGDRIVELRGGTGAGGPYAPEEWIASVTTMAGQEALGLSRLADGTLLRDAVAADPAGWLGPEHVERYGESTELLVKLLDAGERLPVHVHPDRTFSRLHLGLPHGKTEAWIVLDAAEGAQVRLGFAETMTAADVREMTETQNTPALVAALHAQPVRAGDSVLVPAGLPHCIDEGLLVLELQEPTDLSILLEWSGFAIDGEQDGHLGLGFETALGALRLDALDEAELDRLVVPYESVSSGTSLLPAAADPYFRAHCLMSTDVGTDVEPGFAVVLATDGAGRLVTESGERLSVRRGDAAVVPWQAGKWRLDGEVEVVVCRPPLPAEGGTAA